MKTLVLCLLAPLLQGQSLDQVRTRLRALAGQTPLVMEAERQTWSRERQKGALPEQGWAKARIESGASGLRIVPGSESFSAAGPGKDAPRPLGEREAEVLFKASEFLLKTLADAKLQSENPGVWNGQSARYLRFTLPLDQEGQGRVDPDTQKHLQEAWRVLDLWIAPDGTPIASCDTFRIRGRVFVMSFEAGAKIQREYLRFGDRLLVVREDLEAHGSAMGKGSNSRTVLTATPL